MYCISVFLSQPQLLSRLVRDGERAKERAALEAEMQSIEHCLLELRRLQREEELRLGALAGLDDNDSMTINSELTTPSGRRRAALAERRGAATALKKQSSPKKSTEDTTSIASGQSAGSHSHSYLQGGVSREKETPDDGILQLPSMAEEHADDISEMSGDDNAGLGTKSAEKKSQEISLFTQVKEGSLSNSLESQPHGQSVTLEDSVALTGSLATSGASSRRGNKKAMTAKERMVIAAEGKRLEAFKISTSIRKRRSFLQFLGLEERRTKNAGIASKHPEKLLEMPLSDVESEQKRVEKAIEYTKGIKSLEQVMIEKTKVVDDHPRIEAEKEELHGGRQKQARIRLSNELRDQRQIRLAETMLGNLIRFTTYHDERDGPRSTRLEAVFSRAFSYAVAAKLVKMRNLVDFITSNQEMSELYPLYKVLNRGNSSLLFCFLLESVRRRSFCFFPSISID
jgi:hypothetical protein